MRNTIFGLFDSQKDLEAAATKLHKLGLEQFEIVDQARIGGTINLIPGGTPIQPAIGPGTLTGVLPVISSEDDEVGSITSYLEALDFDRAEARFAAQALKRGGSLIVIDLEDNDDADKAQKIMRQANAIQIG